MNIMGQIISECVLPIAILYLYIFDSCWIKSDDGAIAAFIVPIVTIILVV